MKITQFTDFWIKCSISFVQNVTPLHMHVYLLTFRLYPLEERVVPGYISG